MGRALQERADLNIDTLWSGGPRVAAIGNSQALLADFRAAVIDRRNYVEADALIHGLQGPFNEAYQPLGWLTVDFDGIPEPDNYERSLDLSEGVAAVRYEVAGSLYEREAFVSTPDRALIVHMSVRGPTKLSLEIALGSQHPAVSSFDDEGTLWLEGRAPAHVVPHYWPAEPAVVYDEQSGLRFVAGVGVNVVGGALERAAGGSLRVEGADELTLFLAAATGYTAYDRALVEDPMMLRRICRGVFLRLHSKAYPLLRARHVDEHKALFDRCWLQLGRTGAIEAPTDERLQAMRDGSADDGLCALAVPLWPLSLDVQFPRGQPTGQLARNLERSGPTPLELQLDNQHQHPNELLAGRDDELGRMPRTAHGADIRPVARRRQHRTGLLRVSRLGRAP